MNKKQALDTIQPYVESLYNMISLRPSMYAGRAASVEAFIFAIEGVLDYLTEGNRSDRYARFRAGNQFGEESFTPMFERTHNCRLRFVSTAVGTDESDSQKLDDEYSEEFADHWQQFLKWRNQKSSQDAKFEEGST